MGKLSWRLTRSRDNVGFCIYRALISTKSEKEYICSDFYLFTLVSHNWFKINWFFKYIINIFFKNTTKSRSVCMTNIAMNPFQWMYLIKWLSGQTKACRENLLLGKPWRKNSILIKLAFQFESLFYSDPQDKFMVWLGLIKIIMSFKLS